MILVCENIVLSHEKVVFIDLQNHSLLLKLPLKTIKIWIFAVKNDMKK